MEQQHALGAPILEARSVWMTYARRGRLRRSSPSPVLRDVTLTLSKADTVAVVGESGSGKTTLGKVLLGIEQPQAGDVCWQGESLATFKRDDWRGYRRSVQVVLQDPFSALDPRMKLGPAIGESLVARGMKRGDVRTRVVDILDTVRLPADVIGRYPHQLSGGQLQRVAIAQALILEPQVLILDEPVASLDVSIRAQILNLLKDLQDETGMSYVFISHDLASVEFMAREVLVLYKGEVVERNDVKTLFAAPQHPYTQALLESSFVQLRGTAAASREDVSRACGPAAAPFPSRGRAGDPL